MTQCLKVGYLRSYLRVSNVLRNISCPTEMVRKTRDLTVSAYRQGLPGGVKLCSSFQSFPSLASRKRFVSYFRLRFGYYNSRLQVGSIDLWVHDYLRRLRLNVGQPLWCDDDDMGPYYFRRASHHLLNVRVMPLLST